MIRALATSALAAVLLVAGCVDPEATGAGHSVDAVVPAPGTVVAAGNPRKQLGELTVAARGTMDGYDRKKYPHWDNQGNNCNTREFVLKRDGKDVKTSSDCAATSGSWTSIYDGETWTQASDIDIDHWVSAPATPF